MGAADLVVTGARVWTPGARAPSPTPLAVAVGGGRILAVGTEVEVREQVGEAREVLSAPGGLVVPGFQDAHVHAPFAGRDMRRVWLHEIDGRRSYVDAVARYAASHPKATWILGGGWAMEHFPGGTPRREDLDAVVPDRPVFLYNRDVHGAWVNSEVLRLAGITKDTPDPPDGRIERDPLTGEPTGTLHEGAAYSVERALVPKPDRIEWRSAILTAQAYLHTFGITGWQDAWVTPETQAAYSQLAGDGRLTARVVGALWWERDQGLEQIDKLRARRAAARPAAAGGFHVTSVKIMVDGVLENFTGALLEPYCDGCGGMTENRGLTFVDRETLLEAVTRLDHHHFQVHMHAIGDRAVRNALDAVAAARAANPPRDLRHHVAHIQVVDPADLPRFAELDVVANCQAFWAQSEPQMDELTVPFLGPERALQQYPFRSLLRSGARLAMGSDWAVTTPDPLQQIEVAVTRVDPERRDTQPFLPAERLGLVDALEAFTAGSAFVNHDAEAGAVQPGRRADLAVLDTDILAPGAPPPADARVLYTLANGRVVHTKR